MSSLLKLFDYWRTMRLLCFQSSSRFNLDLAEPVSVAFANGPNGGWRHADKVSGMRPSSRERQLVERHLARLHVFELAISLRRALRAGLRWRDAAEALAHLTESAISVGADGVSHRPLDARRGAVSAP